MKKEVPVWLRSIVQERNSVFEPPETSALPPERDTEHEIRLKNGARIPPVKHHRFAPRDTELLNQEVEKLLRQGLIKPYKSEYSASAFIARSDGRKDRMVIDYRGLNEVTEKDKFPLPHLEDMLQATHQAKY